MGGDVRQTDRGEADTSRPGPGAGYCRRYTTLSMTSWFPSGIAVTIAASDRAELQLVEARSAADLDVAFQAMARRGVGALTVLADPVFTVNRARIVDLAAKARLPAMYGIREAADAGGLMSYGPDSPSPSRSSAARAGSSSDPVRGSWL